MHRHLLWVIVAVGLTGCGNEAATPEAAATPAPPAAQPMEFVSHRVVDDAKWWWALTVGDVTNDGLVDLVYIDNNANGGHLAYRTGSQGGGLWPETIIAQEPPTGGTFAAGDLETADMDGDGDRDVLAVKHTGEWDEAGAPAELFWYENPSWEAHPIGEAKDAVKDLSVADFDGDGRADLAVLTFDETNLRVHLQQPDGTFRMVQDITQAGLHEGMDTGDINGDGATDIAANGFVFLNPGGDLTRPWTMETIDPRWNTQTGDWSANGTKTFVSEDFGERPAIFMTHSERAGYPLAYYERRADGSGYDMTTVIEEWPAAHTLQVFDMDLDGDHDIVTGINFARAVNLEPKVDHYELVVMLNDGRGGWTRKLLETEGVYNGRVADFEGDGDLDIFRYPNHEAKELFFIENQVK